MRGARLDRARICRTLALLAVAGVLPGCAAAAAALVYQTETERLKALETWETELAAKDCPGLQQAYTELKQNKDDFVDFDQRQDIVRDKLAGAGCENPQA